MNLPEKQYKLDPALQQGPAYESLRVGPLISIPALLEKYADEPVEKILAEVGLDLNLFLDAENSISFNTTGRLLELSAKKTGISHFGLVIGQQPNPTALGHLGDLATHAQNAGSALYSMILHACLNDRGIAPTISIRNDTAILAQWIYVSIHTGIRHIYSAALAILCNLMRGLCGESWHPMEVRFSNSPPADITPYTSFFNAPVIFNAEEDALVFPEHWLHHPLPNPDPALHLEALNRLATIEAGMDIDLLEKIRSVLPPLIVSQSCKVEQIASMLSMHPRTLNRRLNDHNTSFREMVGEIRYDIAKHMLSDRGMAIIKIANTLGYAEASEFTRAFKRWSGMSPSVWRERYFK